ncbi:MAG: hypothetical protein DRJ33_06655 [Candidatus Methanomethylicota archaeon]|uniref:Uncharacterized protein n=1 Tax=Thermoproteota archaeon TaxID=2056631 RepID=A0A497EWA6_9CREN|nr:MAG: hypothetical protein DRJ33_06655 [Candidatus Verstraetearchaeota archaeon]
MKPYTFFFFHNRGDSQVFSAIVLLGIILAGSYALLPKVYLTSSSSFKGLLDILTKQEEQLKIHIAYVTSLEINNMTEVVMYNYGEHELKIASVLIDGLEAQHNISVYDDNQQVFICGQAVPPKSLFKITFSKQNINELCLILENGLTKCFTIR